MSIQIIKIDDSNIRVNDKLAYQDTNGNWVTQIEFTNQEKEAFNQYLKSTTRH